MSDIRMATLSLLLIFLANFASAQDYDRGVEAYNNGDFQIALQAWLPLAEQGDARSQFNIGWMYDNAIGVRHSDIESVKWYRLAAEQGYALAQNYLGFRLKSSAEMDRDDTEAARWFKRAAEQGDAYGQTNLGLAYLLGEGVDRNDAEAAKWIERSARQGYADGQYFLGLLYGKGQGVPRSLKAAYMWYHIADLNGHVFDNNRSGPAISAQEAKVFIRHKLTSSERSEAEVLARDCIHSNYESCGW